MTDNAKCNTQKTLDDKCKHEPVPNIMLLSDPPQFRCKYCGVAFNDQ